MERAKRAQQIIAAIQLLAIYIRIQKGPNISRQWKEDANQSKSTSKNYMLIEEDLWVGKKRECLMGQKLFWKLYLNMYTSMSSTKGKNLNPCLMSVNSYITGQLGPSTTWEKFDEIKSLIWTFFVKQSFFSCDFFRFWRFGLPWG